MAGTKGKAWSTSRERCEAHIEKERKRIELKRNANLMYANGHSIGYIANKLKVPEGTIRILVSVNGGF